MNLHFKAKDVAELEEKFNDSLFGILGNTKLNNLVIFVEKGLGLNNEEAYAKIDEYLAEGHYLEDLYLLILESVQKNGFLPKEMNFKEMFTEDKPTGKSKK